jgi:hypothetical protein
MKTCLYGTASRLPFLAQTPLLAGGALVSYVLQPIRLPVLAFQRTVSVIRENYKIGNAPTYRRFHSRGKAAD